MDDVTKNPSSANYVGFVHINSAGCDGTSTVGDFVARAIFATRSLVSIAAGQVLELGEESTVAITTWDFHW